MILSLYEVAELKKEIEEKFLIKIHFHDGCGGQYFTVDTPTVELKEFISSYFSKKDLNVIFLENDESFSVKKNI